MSVPERIGPYTVVRPLGEGGMAAVYEVEDPVTRERMALKLHTLDDRRLVRFEREYEAMVRLNHPSIVRAYGFGEFEGHPWLTMELLRGTPAHLWLRNFGKPGDADRTAEVMRVVAHVARALDYLHQRGIVHRDVKASNVLILPDGRVKVVDLGTAYVRDALKRITAEGEFVGTWDYACPEQYLSQPLDGRADLYALGVLFYRLLTGHRPFSGRDPATLAQQHVHEPAPDPRERVPDLPEAATGLVQQLMAKQREHRPWPAAEVARAIERITGTSYGFEGRIALHADVGVLRDRERRALLDGLVEGGAGASVLLVGGSGADGAAELTRLGREAEARGMAVVRLALFAGTDLEAVLDAVRTMAPKREEESAVLAEARQTLNEAALGGPVSVLQAERRVAVGLALWHLLQEGAQRLGRPVLFTVRGAEVVSPLVLDLFSALQGQARETGLPVHVSAWLDRDARSTRERASRSLDVQVVRLNAMGSAELAQVVGAMLGRRPPPSSVARGLHRVTGGHPAFVQAAVEQLVVGGVLRADENRLNWSALGVRVVMPPAARRWAERGLGRLPAVWTRLVEALAVLGTSLPASRVAEALGWETEEVLAVAASLRKRGMLLHREDDRLQLGDTVLQALVLERVHAPRERLLERGLALALDDVARATPEGVTLLVAAGELDAALDQALSLAARVHETGDLYAVVPALARVLAAAPAERTDARWVQAALAYGRCVQVLEPLDPASAKALAEARSHGGDAPGLEGALWLAQARLAVALGHHRSAVRALDEAVRTIDASSPVSLRGELALARAQRALWQGELGLADDIAREAEMVGRAAGFGPALERVRAEVCLGRGELDAVQRRVMTGLISARSLPEARWELVAMGVRGLRLQGRWSEALAQVREHIVAAREADDPAGCVALLVAAAWCEVDLERLGRAQEYVDELAAILRKGEHLHMRLEVELVAGRILLASGQPSEALWTLQSTAERARSAELLLLREQARAYLGEAYAWLGERERARELLRGARLGLLGAGDRVRLAEVGLADMRTLGRDELPDVPLQSVQELLDSGALPVIELQRLLHRGRVLRRRGEDARAIYRQAAELLNRLAAPLAGTERAALRVHPWSRRVRRGLR